MSTKIKWLISLIVAAVVVAGGVSYGIYKHNQPLSDEAFNKLEIDEQFEKAPAGHYVHLRKDDPTLYRTTWNRDKITKYLKKYGSSNLKHNSDGITNAKTKLGTNHTFDDSVLMDSETGDGVIAVIWDAMFKNGYWETKSKKEFNYPEDMFDWYFKSPEQAQEDPDVKENVNQLVR